MYGFAQRTLLEENIDELEELADSGTDLTDAQSKLLASCHERMQVTNAHKHENRDVGRAGWTPKEGPKRSFDPA